MDVNLYGVLRTCQAVLPQMRKQRSGHIINISSVGGSVGTAGRSAYSASKFALNGMSECMALEVRDQVKTREGRIRRVEVMVHKYRL